MGRVRTINLSFIFGLLLLVFFEILSFHYSYFVELELNNQTDIFINFANVHDHLVYVDYLNSIDDINLTIADNNIVIATIYSIILSITNTNISNLDLSNNLALRYLYGANTPLSELDLSNNPLLIELNCSMTQIQELDLSNNPNLKELRLNDGQFEHIDLRNGTNQDINFVTFLNNPNLDYILVKSIIQVFVEQVLFSLI